MGKKRLEVESNASSSEWQEGKSYTHTTGHIYRTRVNGDKIQMICSTCEPMIFTGEVSSPKWTNTSKENINKLISFNLFEEIK